MTVRRALGVLTLTALAVLGVPAVAAAAPADGTTGGWVRLTHLSPDTPAVDVQLTAASDSGSVLALSDVAYGDVSDYTRVPAGTYTASMVPAGGDAADPPAITQSVTVADGQAYTVAAVGLNADLTGTVLTDDLSTPPDGQARIRLLQASVSHPSVTVTAVDGPVLARDAAFATATGYAEIPAGVWSLAVDADGAQVGTATGVRVEPGSVNTLVALDAPDGSVTVTALQDAAGTGVTPSGGVETGGGGTAPADRGPATLAGLVLAAAVVVPVVARRRTV
ncbi:DUF4397 domain-containing protein [Geodermatophilaceae bacterium NBWT11]|nr:DUF4397 domain-containing protein [Geodermatophilaceae bacterium NBWT11]